MSSPELMPSEREQLRARIAEVLKQEARKRRYGNDLKRAIVDYAFARQDERATIGQIAAELGLSAWLLGKWLRHARLRLEKGKIPFEPAQHPVASSSLLRRWASSSQVLSRATVASGAPRMASAFPTAPCAAGCGAAVVMRATTARLSLIP
jgi:transposase-like protein